MIEYENLALRALERLSQPGSRHDTIGDILDMIAEAAGLEAVAIRLHDAGDFPYYVARGFPDRFIRVENSLFSRDESAEIIRDADGNPEYECMCGSVIRGQTDASLPCYTEGGSFWTNSTTELLAWLSKQKEQPRLRNYCNKEGYESVALIPVRARNEIVGLLQFNDSRSDHLTEDMILFFERFGASIGIALTQMQAEEALREARERIVRTEQFSLVMATHVGLDGRWLKVPPKLCELLGYTEEELLSCGFEDVTHPDDIEIGKEQYQKLVQSEIKSFDIEKRYIHKNGSIVWVDINSSIVLDEDGKPVHFLTYVRDISKRKSIEEQREQLIGELQEALNKVNTLSGLLPICASCKKIRDDKGYWSQIETYVQEHSEAEFTHGICPECAKKLYPHLGNKP